MHENAGLDPGQSDIKHRTRRPVISRVADQENGKKPSKAVTFSFSSAEFRCMVLEIYETGVDPIFSVVAYCCVSASRDLSLRRLFAWQDLVWGAS